MKTNTITIDLINREKQEFENEEITIVDGFNFNQKDTIDRIYRYYNSKFETGDIDDQGNKKFFFNIVRSPCKTTTKAIDFDTKHINIQTASGGNPLITWYFERDLKFWMKDTEFGKVLNRIFDELPVFGSVVLKVVKGKSHFIDLRNFIVEQSADNLDNSNYIIERHLYTPVEFRRVGNKLGWDNVEKAITEHRKMDVPYLAVYERYGEIPIYDAKGKPSYTYRRVIIADVGVDEKTDRGKTFAHPGVLMSDVEVDGHPYREFHIEKIAGRWLGMGIVETLFDVQVKQNEIANLQSKSAYWKAMTAFQTRDETMGRNLRTDIQDGDVLVVESEITQIDTTDRNLAYFNQETAKWLQNRDELTFSFDVVQGERLPAGTPLGSAKIAAAQAGSHFDQIQENIALDIKEFLYDVIIPQFIKESGSEHTLRLVGEDLDKLNQLIINQKVTNDLFRFVERKKKLPTMVQYELMKASMEERVKRGKEKLLNMPKDFYKNIKYKIDIIITGEQRDSAIYSQTLFAILQAITTDPTILTDPTKKKIFYKIAEAGGVNLSDIEPDAGTQLEQLAQGTPQRGGGGVSRPSFAETPKANNTRTL